MAVAFSYLSREDFKNRLANLGSGDTNDDAKIDLILQGVSQKIDQYCGRRFQPYTATRTFTADSSSILDVDDLLSITTLKHDEDGDGTYETTWASTDYLLWPFNAAVDERPYTQIRIAPQGTKSFPATPNGVQVVGTWGYRNSRVSAVTTASEAIDASETAIDVASGSALEILQTILIDSEQMFITGISTNTLTVKRGVNGTTAATHDNGASIDVYEYPFALCEAAYLMANRALKRAGSPFGVAGSADMGTAVVIPRIDPDVRQYLSAFERLYVGVF